jgi:hypothetical protein
MFHWIVVLAGLLAPCFITLSPFLSYGDQAWSMWKRKSSAGFSIDIPLIMLFASMCKIFYWPGARFDTSLLLQAAFTIIMQIALLKIALDHRPPPSSAPFAGAADGGSGFRRPFDFWQWRSPTPYWQTVLYFFILLLACELVFAPMPPIYASYSAFIGYAGLAVEAILPVPQILKNRRARSCRGFRASVVLNWLVGDAIKMIWFFTSTSEIPWSFKLCAIFQSCCDSFLGMQFLYYGSAETTVKDNNNPLVAMPRAGGGAYPMPLQT